MLGTIRHSAEGAFIIQTGENTAEAARQAGLAASSAAAASGSADDATASAVDAAASAAAAEVSATAAEADRILAESVADAAGALLRFSTKAAMDAAIGSIAADEFVEVQADETMMGWITRYRKEGGVMVYKGALPAQTGVGGLVAAASRQIGTIVQIGDSNTDNVSGRPGWQAAADIEWFGAGAPLEGWTSNNIGNNGSKITDWTGSIASGSGSTPTNTRGSLWAAVNADPDIIVVRIGTNDFGLDAVQATNGVLATARANFKTLVNFLLSNSSAHLLLAMPQPYAFESFTGAIWADANEAADYSDRMRQLYLDWIGVNDRITVYDSHRDLFGYRVDNKASAALDPVTAAPMMADSLHPSNVGFRRLAQRQARMMNPTLRRSSRFNRVPSATAIAAAWGLPVYISATEVGGTLLTIRTEMQKVLGGKSADFLDDSSTVALNRVPGLDALFSVPNLGSRWGLYALYNATVKVYFPASGTTYTCSTFRFSSTATVGSGEYADKFSITGTTISETGPALIYVENWGDSPLVSHTQLVVNVERTTDILVPIYTHKGMRTEIISIRAQRIGFAGITGSCDGYYFTGNTGVVTGTLAFSVAFGAGLAEGSGTINATNYPSGLKIDTRSQSATNGIRLTNFTNFGGAGKEGNVVLTMRHYPV